MCFTGNECVRVKPSSYCSLVSPLVTVGMLQFNVLFFFFLKRSSQLAKYSDAFKQSCLASEHFLFHFCRLCSNGRSFPVFRCLKASFMAECEYEDSYNFNHFISKPQHRKVNIISEMMSFLTLIFKSTFLIVICYSPNTSHTVEAWITTEVYFLSLLLLETALLVWPDSQPARSLEPGHTHIPL